MRVWYDAGSWQEVESLPGIYARATSIGRARQVLLEVLGWTVTLYDIWFRPIFAFFIVDVNTKRVVHIGVTRAPTEEWTAQQLREVTPFGEGP